MMDAKRLQLYGHNDARNYNTFFDHMMAMTEEDLHGKCEIACELAWRDQQIEELQAQNEIIREVLEEISKRTATLEAQNKIMREALEWL